MPFMCFPLGSDNNHVTVCIIQLIPEQCLPDLLAQPRLRVLIYFWSHISSNKSKTFCQTASKLQTICNNSCQLSVQSSETNLNLTFYWCWQQWPLIHKLGFLNKKKRFYITYLLPPSSNIFLKSLKLVMPLLWTSFRLCQCSIFC